MLEQIFTKEFLTKTRRTTVIILSLIKYVCLAIGAPFAILFASGVDAPEPYGSNTLKACAFCIGLCVMAMLIEMFVVRFLVKENEHIHCIFDFNWYGLKDERQYKEYMRYIRQRKAEEKARHKKFKRMISMTNMENTENRDTVVQFPNTHTVRYKEARRM